MIGIKNLIRLSFERYHTLIHKNDPVGNISRKAHLMRDDHHRDLQVCQ